MTWEDLLAQYASIDSMDVNKKQGVLLELCKCLESQIHNNEIKWNVLSFFERLMWKESDGSDLLFNKEIAHLLLPILMDVLLMNRSEIEILRSSIHIVLGLKDFLRPYYNNIIAALVSVLSEEDERDATTLIPAVEVINHILAEGNDDGHLLEVIPCIFSHFKAILTHILEFFDTKKVDSEGEGASMLGESLRAVIGLLCIMSKALADRDILTLSLEESTINTGVEKLCKDLSLLLPISRLNEIEFYVGKALSADRRGICDDIKHQIKSLRTVMGQYLPNSVAPDDTEDSFSGSISSFLDKVALSNNSNDKSKSTKPNNESVGKSAIAEKKEKMKKNVVVPSPIETASLPAKDQSVTPIDQKSFSTPSLDPVSRLVNDSTRQKTEEDYAEKDNTIGELLKWSKLNQEQAVEAIKRADMLQELFIDATKKIELLMKENESLRNKVDPATIAQFQENSPRDGDSPRSVRRVTISTKPLPAASESTTATDDQEAVTITTTNPTTNEDRLKSLAMGGLVENLNTLKDRKEDGDGLVIDTDVNALYPAAEKVKELFEFLKFTHVGFAAERKNLESLALSTLRRAMSPLGFIEADVFTLNDVDIAFSQLGVQQVSLFGLSYVLMNCLRKRFKYLTANELVAKLVVMTTEYLEQQKSIQAAKNSGRQRKTSDLQPTIHQEDISDNDWDELKKLLDMEQSAIDVIFRAYRPNSPLKQGRNRTTNKEIQVISYESAVHFALDIGIIPNLLTTSHFHSIARNSLFYDDEDPSEYGQLSIEQFKNVIVNLALCVPLFKKSLEKERTRDTDIPATVLLSHLFLFMRTHAQLWHTNISKRSSHRGAIALPVLKFKLDTIRARSSVQAATGENEKKRMIMSMCAPSKEHVFGINTGGPSKTFLKPNVPNSNRF